MRWWNWIYMPGAVAKEMGMTHAGTLYGLPVWFGDVDNQEEVHAIAKIPLLALYFLSMDFAFECFTLFLAQDLEVKTPIVIGDPIP